MIVLGVAPGLAKLAYAVLSFRGGSAAEPIDCDVLHSTGHSETAPMWKIGKSARVHHMIMGVVLDRHPPAALSIGPPLDPKEPTRHVEPVRSLLMSVAMGLRARVVTFETERDLRRSFSRHYGEDMHVGERGLRRAVRCALASPLPTKDRRVMLATATALAGAFEIRSELPARRK